MEDGHIDVVDCDLAEYRRGTVECQHVPLLPVGGKKKVVHSLICTLVRVAV